MLLHHQARQAKRLAPLGRAGDLEVGGLRVERHLTVLDFLDLGELALTEGIVSTEKVRGDGGMGYWRGKSLGGAPRRKGWKLVVKRDDRARLATGFCALLYPVSQYPTFKFWTYESTYALERLLKPTVSPQAKWG